MAVPTTCKIDQPEARLRLGPTPNPTHQSIYELADAGLTPDQIAHELNQLPGQVELILNLRQA